MSKTTKQKLQELELEVRLLKQQRQQITDQKEKKAAILDMMIAIAEEEYNTELQKKASAQKPAAPGKKREGNKNSTAAEE